ncbi:hypothetical protein PUV54_05455 [Hyphococcus flavus]|uniref:WD40-like Beta Propeller Repeat n=1 Tax=Hyphococcus flavus TaxID=1866326 RepID=A0AAE9ZDP0_9PROT|nr:hypothetical protein [Hyphococcus flavus]WDI32641.1 hypothetical protein PUV54_05455 [Hyphococcus flavus]
MKNFVWLFVLALAACGAPDQSETAGVQSQDAPAGLPGTDIYIATLSSGADGVSVSGLNRITEGGGYDNQPYFLASTDAFYFVSEGDSGKTDLWRYDILSASQTRVTNTPSFSEYSPKPAPGDYGVSYIQEIDESGETTQVYHMPGSGEPAAVAEFKPLGYYAWLADGQQLGVFLRTEPGELHLVDIESGETRKLASNIGRSLQPSPDGQRLYFTQADDSGAQSIMMFDLDSGDISAVAALNDGMDFFWPHFDDAGSLERIFSGADSVLYDYMPSGNTNWRPVHDFSEDGLSGLTRLAVNESGTWIALVFDE